MPECERRWDHDWFWAHCDTLAQEVYNPETQRFERPGAPPAHTGQTNQKGEICMQTYSVTTGAVAAPAKVVLYGPEGIGKTTLAAAFPGALFLDTEGGSGRLNVSRLPRPEHWAMLLDEVEAVRRGRIACGTLVVDTADWAERLCARAVCERAGVRGIEDFGYGKGYTYLKEEFARLLEALDGVIAAGRNVVVTAHAQITKFEQPDEMGSYDRWTMKTSKQVAPLLREWCDALLFANYKTFVVKDGEGKAAKGKAQGGRRVLYTAHHPCWDAKNRFGLPEEVPMAFDAIASIVANGGNGQAGQSRTAPDSVGPSEPSDGQAAPPNAAAPSQIPAPPSRPAAPASSPAPSAPRSVDALPVQPAEQTPQPAAAEQTAAPSAAHAELLERMRAADITDAELRRAVYDGGYYPEDMPVADYPAAFVSGRLLAGWDGVVQAVADSRDLPF